MPCFRFFFRKIAFSKETFCRLFSHFNKITKPLSDSIMKTSSFFLSTLIAAAAMSANAYAADYTVTDSSNTLINATSEDTVTIDFSSNSNSYLYADNIDSSYTINANVIIANATIHNGYSNRTYIFNGVVTGSGDFYYQADSGSNNQNYVFNGDVSGYSGNMIINASKYGSFTFNNNKTGTGTITATSAWCTVNFNSATVNNSEVNAATINISGTTSFVTDTSLIGKVVIASGATVSNTGTLNISGTTVSLNGGSVSNTGTVTVGVGTVFNLTSIDGMQTLISGGTITGWDSLNVSNFTLNGSTLSGRSSVDLSTAGQVSVTEIVANLVWSGNVSSTWDVESTKNWTNSGKEDAFYMKDNVEFTSASTGSVDVAAGVTVGDFTVTSGTHTLTRSNSGYVAITGTGTVKNGATLILASETSDTGLLRGAITVENGGTLQFDAKDVTGYNGGANSLQTITVEEGGTLVMNVDGNETFAGTLNLGGTIAKGENAGSQTAWDIWGNDSSINVKSATAKIETDIRIGRSNAVITLDNGSLLSVSGNIVLRDNGTDTLKIDGGNGSGSFAFTGRTGTIGEGVKLGNGSLTIGDGENVSFLTVGRIEIGDNGSGNGEGNSAVSRLNIEKGSTLKITGSTNTWNSTGDYKHNSVVLGEWSNTTYASIKGTLLAKDAEIGMGDWGAHIAVDGLLVAKGLGQASQSAGDFAVTLNEGGKILIGESGISDKRSSQGSITLNAGTVGTYADATTLALGMTLNSEKGTTFDSQKYVFAEDGNSVSQGGEGAEISVTGALSGTGALTKTGAGTLTLSGTNTYSGGTTIEAGTLVAGRDSALGTGAVKVSGGKLEVSSGVTVSNAIEIVLNSAYTTEAAIQGAGTLTSAITVSGDLDALVSIQRTIAQQYEYQLLSDSLTTEGVTVTLSTELESAIASKGWSYDYDTTSGMLTLTIPEPSAFGLLAGVGALALVVSRRRRFRR